MPGKFDLGKQVTNIVGGAAQLVDRGVSAAERKKLQYVEQVMGLNEVAVLGDQIENTAYITGAGKKLNAKTWAKGLGSILEQGELPTGVSPTAHDGVAVQYIALSEIVPAVLDDNLLIDCGSMTGVRVRRAEESDNIFIATVQSNTIAGIPTPLNETQCDRVRQAIGGQNNIFLNTVTADNQFVVVAAGKNK